METAPEPSLASRPADAPPRSWVDALPARAQPFLRLGRYDRPIGIWLLMWPCWWSTALAAPAAGERWPDPWLLLLFFAGAAVMRGAGCTYNDIVDREIDAQVARTRGRPLPSGQVSLPGAWAFLAAQCLIGLAVLLQLNPFTQALGAASLLLVAAYPFMKRVTWWPQAFLGLTFNWGALVGWAAVTGGLNGPALLLYAGCVLWTIGYDTIYAHQDKEDDALIGVKSTARLFGAATVPWLTAFYAGTLVLWAGAFASAGFDLLGWRGAGLVALTASIAAFFVRQVRRLRTDDPALCLALFKENHWLGLMVFGGLMSIGALSG